MKRILPAGERYAFNFNVLAICVYKYNIMLKLTFSLIFLFFMLKPISAQNSSEDMIFVSAGQKVPESFWEMEFTFYDHDIVYRKTLKEYKNKPILISFWMVHCGPCLASFPTLYKIREKYGDDLIVLAVNSLMADSISSIDKVFSKRPKEYKIPVIIQDNYMKSIFPHGPIPYYVWIQPNGIVGAQTRRTFLNMDLVNFFYTNHEE